MLNPSTKVKGTVSKYIKNQLKNIENFKEQLKQGKHEI